MCWKPGGGWNKIRKYSVFPSGAANKHKKLRCNAKLLDFHVNTGVSAFVLTWWPPLTLYSFSAQGNYNCEEHLKKLITGYLFLQWKFLRRKNCFRGKHHLTCRLSADAFITLLTAIQIVSASHGMLQEIAFWRTLLCDSWFNSFPRHMFVYTALAYLWSPSCLQLACTLTTWQSSKSIVSAGVRHPVPARDYCHVRRPSGRSSFFCSKTNQQPQNCYNRRPWMSMTGKSIVLWTVKANLWIDQQGSWCFHQKSNYAHVTARKSRSRIIVWYFFMP